MFTYTTRGIQPLRQTRTAEGAEKPFTFAQTSTFTPGPWLEVLVTNHIRPTRLTVPFEGVSCEKGHALDPDRGLTMEAMFGYPIPGCKRSEWAGSEPSTEVRE